MKYLVPLVIVAFFANAAYLYWLTLKMLEYYMSLEADIASMTKGLDLEINASKRALEEILAVVASNQEDFQKELVDRDALALQSDTEHYDTVLRALDNVQEGFKQHYGNILSHAKQIIDARNQHDNQGVAPRTTCNTCGRVVHSWERQKDGTAKCTDCIKTGRK